MKNLKKYLLAALVSLSIISCSEDGIPVANDVTLEFNNTFGATTIVLGDATSAEATTNTSTEGQVHNFSELKYIFLESQVLRRGEFEVIGRKSSAGVSLFELSDGE